MSTTISWNLRLDVRTGMLDDFRALMSEMVESTQAEVGTVLYEWFLSADHTACHINERYTDSAAAMTHLGTFGSTFAERFMGCVEPTSLTVYGEPSDELRTMLDGFGAAYLGTFGGFSR